MSAGYGSNLFTMYGFTSGGNISSGRYIGAYDVGAGNMLLVRVRTNIHMQPTQPTEWGFFIRWDGSPRKSANPPNDPGPGYKEADIPRGQYEIVGPSVANFAGMLGPLTPNSYSVAPPAGIRSYDWNYPLFRIPCNNDPGAPQFPWTPPAGVYNLYNDFLWLLPAPMDFAKLVWYVNPSPFAPAGTNPFLTVAAGAVTGCSGFSMPQKP